jgi:hypothetical protein
MIGENELTTECGNRAPLDSEGRPTTYLCFMILRLLFSQARRWFTTEELCTYLAARRSDVDLLCSQLKKIDLILESPSRPERYSYNLGSTNVDIQAQFEKFMVDVEAEALPVNFLLPYSPSFR